MSDHDRDDHGAAVDHDDRLFVYDVHVLVDGLDYRAVDHDVRIDHHANTVNELVDNYGDPAHRFDVDPSHDHD